MSTNKLDKISLLVSSKKIMFTIQNLIVSTSWFPQISRSKQPYRIIPRV